ncbi:MAG TPA: transporter substrate-binding domain-containing protein, partial [Spirochaetota bacterium]|nr:transporter substrate-binding domain-containing protein [Spirochaetota bacterium]
DSVSIEKLLDDTRFDGGVMQKRSYGEIDPLIKQYENKRILHTLSPNSDIIQMLLTGRLDYVIEIVSFANYRARQAGKENELRSYAIKEYSQPVLIAHVFCTKNEWGKKMIERINRILLRERKNPEYLELMTRWYDDRSKKVIRQYYNSQFLK